MAFEDDANIAVAQFQALRSSLDGAVATTNEIRATIEETEGEVDEKVQLLESEIESLTSELAEHQERLASEGQQLVEEFQGTMERIGNLVERLGGEAGDVVERFEAFDGKVDEFQSTIDENIEASEGASRTLAEGAQETQTSVEAGSEANASRYGEGLPEQVGETESAIGARSTEVAVRLSEHAQPALTSGLDETIERTDGTLNELSERGEETRTRNERHQGDLAAKTSGELEEMLGGLGGRTGEFANNLKETAASIQTVAQTLNDGKDLVKTASVSTNMGLNSAIGIIREIKELFDRFN